MGELLEDQHSNHNNYFRSDCKKEESKPCEFVNTLPAHSLVITIIDPNRGLNINTLY